MFKNRSKILSESTLQTIFDSAIQMLQVIGLETQRSDLLETVKNLPGFTSYNQRIRISRERIEQVLRAMQQSASKPAFPEHPTLDVTDRSTSFADHHNGKLIPLTRQHAINGCKLLHSLSDKWVIAKSCGTPQDVPEPLRAIEQYMIGFRYNRNGGSTSAPLPPETAAAFRHLREIAEDTDSTKRNYSVWLPSPLKLHGNEIDDLLEFGTPASFCVGSMPIMGLTGPIDPVGIYTLALAETIGGAAVLSAIFPEAEPNIYPHPEPMDPYSRLLAFGTRQWLRLSLMHADVMQYLGLHRADVDILTSSCLPDARAQADKHKAITAALYHGFETLRLFPLCGDEAWSHVQLMLDVETVHSVWQTIKPENSTERANTAFATMCEAIFTNSIAGGCIDTLLHMSETYPPTFMPRVFSAGQYYSKGSPDAIVAAEEEINTRLQSSDFSPDDYKWKNIITIYHSVCKQIGIKPFHFD